MRSRPVVVMSSASRSCSSIGGGSEAVLLRRPPGWPTKLPLVLPLKLEEEARRSTQESLKEVDFETEIVRGMVALCGLQRGEGTGMGPQAGG